MEKQIDERTALRSNKLPEAYTLADVAMKVMRDRRSIREYSREPVSEEDLRKILETGQLVPLGENAQPWRFIVQDAATRKKLGALDGGRSKCEMHAPVPPDCRLCFFPPVSGG